MPQLHADLQQPAIDVHNLNKGVPGSREDDMSVEAGLKRGNAKNVGKRRCSSVADMWRFRLTRNIGSLMTQSWIAASTNSRDMSITACCSDAEAAA